MSIISRFRYHYGFYKLDKPFIKPGLPSLTPAEKSLIKDTWTGLDISFLDFTWSRIYKKEKGFSPYYLGALWNQDVDNKVNPTIQVTSLENKALCDVYFPEIKFPEPYVRCLNGSLFDKEMNFITLNKAIDILKEKGEFIIKPSVDSMQGKNVLKIDMKKCNDLASLFKSMGRNFIAQEVIKQLPFIEKLNPTSLNCFRITSMYFNGKYDYAAALKIGKKGAILDNWNSAYWIGVDKKGKLVDFGYDYNIERIYQSDNGIKFSGIVIPLFDKLISFVEYCHKKYFPNCGIIGWDITIDSKEDIRVIETNLKNPGTQIEQLCSGPFLKPFRDDICQILTAK